MSTKFTHFRDHHLIEQRTLPKDPLLQELKSAGIFNIHSDRNLIYLPTKPDFAYRIGITPHSGAHIIENQRGIIDELRFYRQTIDYQLFDQGDLEAGKRLAGRVERFQDFLRIGLSNGDLHINAPLGKTADDIRSETRSFYAQKPSYISKETAQISAINSMQSEEIGWRAIVHSEKRITTTLLEISNSDANLTRGGDDPSARNRLSRAISQAHAAGRLTLSEQGILQVENTLGEEAARPLRIPFGQRGFATAEFLVGELSANQALRTAGLLATAADTVMAGQRATRLLGQDNPLAAQSELAHFAGRNIGGWAGGTAAAYALGSSGAGPMVLIAADAYFLSTAGEKAAELLDNRAIYTQTDRDGTQWSFNGTAWARDGRADTSNDGIDNPTATPIVASYEKARELNYQ
ncbi:hypothetical protein LL962_20775, partial [Xanthomonas sp. NCPPB 1067]|uniref:hypothetical protein n=1 Tax=Xanthomonas sp. NCPPB 1067 TaxID=487524 RepID=UPI001E424673